MKMQLLVLGVYITYQKTFTEQQYFQPKCTSNSLHPQLGEERSLGSFHFAV